jgi:hypothetical protein
VQAQDVRDDRGLAEPARGTHERTATLALQLRRRAARRRPVLRHLRGTRGRYRGVRACHVVGLLLIKEGRVLG